MEAWPLIVGAVTDALNLDWSELSYKRSSLVIKAAAFIAAVFFTTLVVRWWRSASARKGGRRIDYSHIPFRAAHKRSAEWRFIGYPAMRGIGFVRTHYLERFSRSCTW